MNIFEYAAREEKLFESMLENIGSNYKRKTTFFSDLSIGECFGEEGIKDTYKNVCESWISDHINFTEFILCLNYKAWEWNGRGDDDRAELYSNLYYEAMDKFYKHYEGNEKVLDYFYEVTD